MDDYMFRSHVTNCKVVREATSYLEILNYSVSRSFFCKNVCVFGGESERDRTGDACIAAAR